MGEWSINCKALWIKAIELQCIYFSSSFIRPCLPWQVNHFSVGQNSFDAPGLQNQINASIPPNQCPWRSAVPTPPVFEKSKTTSGQHAERKQNTTKEKTDMLSHGVANRTTLVTRRPKCPAPWGLKLDSSVSCTRHPSPLVQALSIRLDLAHNREVQLPFPLFRKPTPYIFLEGPYSLAGINSGLWMQIQPWFSFLLCNYLNN